MDREEAALVESISADPRYRDLVGQRLRLGWFLSALIFAAFAGYLLLIAFNKGLLETPVGDGVTSLGIPLGLGLIIFAIALTGVYVAYANRRFDARMAAILRDHGA
ncbi:DUF485 domain-containing protein [Sphingobium vermicomposti]|uniref:DUF485 domain-containing protein n=1 Tax=Sphingobium vermicomposti TaxID=529005 RepID=UPI001421B0F0